MYTALLALQSNSEEKQETETKIPINLMQVFVCLFDMYTYTMLQSPDQEIEHLCSSLTFSSEKVMCKHFQLLISSFHQIKRYFEGGLHMGARTSQSLCDIFPSTM